MALSRQSGPGMLLPVNMNVYNRASGLYANPGAGPIALAAGASFVIPAGQWFLNLGGFSFLQVYDPILGGWRTMGSQGNDNKAVLSDGQNFRVANLSGCMVGAIVSNVGSGYTSAPTVTPSSGTTAWRAIVGGAINSTVTVTTAGAGYNYPPVLLFDPPPAGGVQASAVATVSAGAISAVTVIDQGAGYVTAPNITVIPDPRDTITTQAVLTVNATLAGSGTVTAVICTDHGAPVSAVPTLSFAGGGGSSAAATAIACFTVTAFTVGAGGAAYGNAQPFFIMAGRGKLQTTPGAVVNPSVGTGMFLPRSALIYGVSTAGGAIQTTSSEVQDGGIHQRLPVGAVIPAGNSIPTTIGEVTMTAGGVTDVSYLYQA
jgi:hypothetical protein